ncbi:polyprenyl synthetase family protein [Proteocatella sphenisci]|uniref:polyprenyl synthetase family protein n=1 Tax=Proteocatella sphenisci TaxID=181070 RepID=UPI00048CE044|nr:farnesyl diphosphate synthase [Proteocatella sphenisci]
MKFTQQYNATKKDVEENLISFIDHIAGTPQKTIFESMIYSLEAGGKRIRPVLLLETLKMLGGNYTSGLAFACAVEYIHTYSLIHDDLPAMDDDDLRRGKPTNHKVFGEAIAILSGDGLLNSAFEIMSDEILKNNSAGSIKAMNVISKCAGINGMIAGQIVDIESEGKTISYEELRYLHSKKTGALIEASVIAGAYLAGADEKEIDAVKRYAQNIGLAFQIADDILDVVGDSKDLGKNTGSDKENEKSTYVSLFGIEKARLLAQECLEDAIKSLDIFDSKNRVFLEELARFIVLRKN